MAVPLVDPSGYLPAGPASRFANRSLVDVFAGRKAMQCTTQVNASECETALFVTGGILDNDREAVTSALTSPALLLAVNMNVLWFEGSANRRQPSALAMLTGAFFGGVRL